MLNQQIAFLIEKQLTMGSFCYKNILIRVKSLYTFGFFLSSIFQKKGCLSFE